MSPRATRSNLVPGRAGGRDCLTAVLLAMTLAAGLPFAPQAGAAQQCVRADIVLWGDGRHDDTAALNAWLRGEPAIWAASGMAVGTTIAGRSFRLSAAVYAPGGSGRILTDFRFLWPERGERVEGGTIRTGGDPAAAPVMSGVEIVDGDAGEGKPFEMPDAAAMPDDAASCATS